MKLFEIKLQVREGHFCGYESEDNIAAKDAISAVKFYIKQTNAEYAQSHKDGIACINADFTLTAAQTKRELEDWGSKSVVYTLEDLHSVKYLNEIMVAE